MEEVDGLILALQSGKLFVTVPLMGNLYSPATISTTRKRLETEVFQAFFRGMNFLRGQPGNVRTSIPGESSPKADPLFLWNLAREYRLNYSEGLSKSSCFNR
ncbi:MAG: hypothetical protein ACOYJZ_05375 [Acutalibacter sp.]